MKPKCMVFMSGQPRCIDKAMVYLKKNLLTVNANWDFYLFLGLDAECLPKFEKEFSEGFIETHFFCTHRNNLFFFKEGKRRIEKDPNLPPFWKDYLISRSGSILEYAQFSCLHQKAMSLHPPQPQDLLLRARTDVFLLTPWILDRQHHPLLMDPLSIFKTQFPENPYIKTWDFPYDREGCILPLKRENPKWVISLRKNLMYLMPYQQGSHIKYISLYYGKWDSIDENTWWFNAESQFRGYLRQNGFTVFDLSQQKDESWQEECSSCDFPIYMIYRAK